MPTEDEDQGFETASDNGQDEGYVGSEDIEQTEEELADLALIAEAFIVWKEQ
jgi:hypothetical protein